MTGHTPMYPVPAAMRRHPIAFALFGLILLHYVVVGLYVFEVIPQEFNPPDRIFWLHNGGDNADYFNLAQSLIEGDVVASKYPIGFPITLIPFIVLLRPQYQEQLLEPVAAFWALVMFPLAQILLFRLAALLTGRRRLALLTVLLWTLLPLAMWLGLRVVTSAQVAETSSVHLIWAQMLSDGPATLLTIVAFLLYAILRRTTAQKRVLMWAAALGVTMGALVLVRYTGALSVAAILALLALERRWTSMSLAGILTAAVASLQLAYNFVFFGNPLTTGYTVLDALPAHGLFDPWYLTDALGRALERAPLAVLAGLLISGALFAAGVWAIGRFNRWSALVVVFWTVPYLVFYSVYYYSWTGSLLRLLIPIYPALSIVLAAALFEVYRALRRTPARA